MRLELKNTDDVAKCVYDGELPYNTSVVVPLGAAAAYVKGGDVVKILREGESKVNEVGSLKAAFSRCRENQKIYIVNMSKPFTVLWGSGGMEYRDIDGKRSRVGASGSYRFTADNVTALLRKFGFAEAITEGDVKRQMKGAVLSAVNSEVLAALGEGRNAMARTEKITAAAQRRLEAEFGEYGLFLDKLFIEEITDLGAEDGDEE